MPPEPTQPKRRCSLLLFVATSPKKKRLKQSAEGSFGLPFEKIKDPKLES